MRSQVTRHREAIIFCNFCLQHFRDVMTSENHKRRCSKIISYVPTADKSTLEFKNYFKQLDVPFVIYADSECIFENIQTCIPNECMSSTTLVDRHIPYAFFYFIKCNFDQSLNSLRMFVGLDSPKKLVESLVNDVKYLSENFIKVIKPMTPLTERENLDFITNNTCHIINENKVKDHCHLSGKYRGPAHYQKVILNG